MYTYIYIQIYSINISWWCTWFPWGGKRAAPELALVWIWHLKCLADLFGAGQGVFQGLQVLQNAPGRSSNCGFLWFPRIFCDVFWWEEKQLWSSGRKHVPIFWRKKNAIESGGTWVFFRSRSFSWSFKASSLSAIWRRKVAWGVAVAIGRQGHSGQKSGELSWWLSHLATSSTHPPSDLFLQTLPGANPIKSQSSMAAYAPWTRSK